MKVILWKTNARRNQYHRLPVTLFYNKLLMVRGSNKMFSYESFGHWREVFMFRDCHQYWGSLSLSSQPILCKTDSMIV